MVVTLEQLSRRSPAEANAGILDFGKSRTRLEDA
jgi:hypothetical protein